MKRAGKYLSLAAVLLLLLGGGVFLWHSGFFAAASSQESMQAYIQRFAPYSHLCFFLVRWCWLPFPAISPPWWEA